MQDGIAEVMVGSGWRAWWVDVVLLRQKAVQLQREQQERLLLDASQFQEINEEPYPNRVHGGFRAQKYYSQARMHEGGLYQRVTGITTERRCAFRSLCRPGSAPTWIPAARAGFGPTSPTRCI